MCLCSGRRSGQAPEGRGERLRGRSDHPFSRTSFITAVETAHGRAQTRTSFITAVETIVQAEVTSRASAAGM